MNKRILGGIVAAAGIAVVILVIVGGSLESEPQTPEILPARSNHDVGLVVNTPTSSITIDELRKVYQQATSTGIVRNNLYMFWNLVEPEKGQYDWNQSDVLLSLNKQNNLKATLYFSVINGKTLGPFPNWMGSPTLSSIPTDDLVDVLDAILSRYNIIDTVIIGGDSDAFFRYEEEKILNYKELFNPVYEQIKEKHPEVKMGNAFSLQGVLNKNLEHIVQELDVGDFVAFTYFPTNSLNEIDKTPLQAVQDLEKIFELVPDKKVGLFEISWSTASSVGGTQEDQVEFLRNTFEFYRENDSKIEFFTWFRQYDKPDGTCEPDIHEVEGSVSVGGSLEIGSSEFVIERLGHYICNAGLVDIESNPKLGWDEFTAQIKNLNP